MITVIFIYYFLVQMARCLFPTEAQLAMELAPMKGTSEFTVDSQELDGTGAKRSAPDQYMVPFVFEEKHRSRLEALSKTGIDSLSSNKGEN